VLNSAFFKDGPFGYKARSLIKGHGVKLGMQDEFAKAQGSGFLDEGPENRQPKALASSGF
jgi:hypothetical protein